MMVVGSLAELSLGFWSPPPDTVTVFVTRPGALLATFAFNVITGYEALEAKASLRVQVTPETGLGQLQPVPLTALKVSPVGKVSVTVTVVPSVAFTPLFVTVIVYGSPLSP